jgi:protein MAK16
LLIKLFSEEYEVVSRKAEKREKSREVKAEKAAVVEMHIEQELLEKLKSNQVYKEFYNVDKKLFEKVVGQLEKPELEEVNIHINNI